MSNQESVPRLGGPLEGRDVAAFGGPVLWGCSDSSDILEEVRSRLEGSGEATLILDPGYPTSMTSVAFRDEIHAMGRGLSPSLETVAEDFRVVLRGTTL